MVDEADTTSATFAGFAPGDEFPGEIPTDRERLWPRISNTDVSLLLILDSQQREKLNLTGRRIDLYVEEQDSIAFIAVSVEGIVGALGYFNPLLFSEESRTRFLAAPTETIALYSISLQSEVVQSIQRLDPAQQIVTKVDEAAGKSVQTYGSAEDFRGTARSYLEDFDTPQAFAKTADVVQSFSA